MSLSPTFTLILALLGFSSTAQRPGCRIETNNLTHTHVHIYRQSPINLTCSRRKPENPHRLRQEMQTSHRKAPEHPYSGATHTAPPCCPAMSLNILNGKNVTGAQDRVGSCTFHVSVMLTCSQ